MQESLNADLLNEGVFNGCRVKGRQRWYFGYLNEDMKTSASSFSLPKHDPKMLWFSRSRATQEATMVNFSTNLQSD